MDEQECSHPSCTCEATIGEYCSDWCREHTSEPQCLCGHEGCQGDRPEEALTG
jgi:hypothetical protein